MHTRASMMPAVLALAIAMLAPPLVPSGEGAVVLCQRKNKVRLRVDACKKKETRLDPGELTPCAPDAVRVGGVCVDRVEASIWRLPPAATELVDSIRAGTVTLEALTAAGAFQLGDVDGFSCEPGTYPGTFPPTGVWTEPLYAVAVPGVVPSRCVTWFQAQQACALSGKRLLTNAEWQLAATGTPDPGVDDGVSSCAVGGTVVGAGSRSACVSPAGVFDAVGNAWEWVADWGGTTAGVCSTWSPGFGDDLDCVTIDGSSQFLGALVRGGSYDEGGTNAGPFATRSNSPTSSTTSTGFRCGR